MAGRPLILRTMYCLDKLRLDQGIGAPTIYKRVFENQFQRFGLRCMSYESVRDLFRGRSAPGVDPPLMNDPAHDLPWLFALELEFPGATDAFFHPAFDIFWGDVESRHYWKVRVQKIPIAWIEEARSTGRADLAKQWTDENLAVGKRGRPKTQPPREHDIDLARHVLFRLPPSVRDPLFKRIRSSSYVSRRFRDADAEVEACLQAPSLDSLTALMALLLEAEAITAWDRFHVIRRAIKVALPHVVGRPECKRIADDLRSEVKLFLLGGAPCRTLEDRFYHGKPISWRCHLAPPVVHYFEEIFGHPPD